MKQPMKRDIVEDLRESMQVALATAASIEREISLLREYRTRLIADVVTGKLDAVPEEAEA